GGAILLRLPELLADRSDRHCPVLGLDDDADLRAARPLRIDRDDEVALLGAEHLADLVAGAVDDVACASGRLREQRREDRLEVAALGGRSCPLDAPRRRCGLDGAQALVQALEAGADLAP